MKELSNVSVSLKANVYFDGGVVSHTLVHPNGSKQSIGVIRPGSYHFTTQGAERMEIVAGTCQVRRKDDTAWTTFAEGSHFDVPAQSAFDISVENGLAEYVCTFK